ncbi:MULTISPECIES: hypothetical protein [unclassified Rhizobium]|uniref:hypothetical protein n=1 Tax=unclassified Rhizobium TaxID=2613769 RepID=UPI000EAA1A1F|nr:MULTISPECIES: hypothetical protein [unclassified Rhizobium]AYG66845.1 hypothetical protein CCGE531_13165 [Rhizobium sp. CCGE531]AYG73225.1 hypothetical protein CCGE532_12585 [Rhizobium sp. CCGE532]
MGPVRITLTVAGFCLALSACNTTDALTPPEAIGDAGSSPVTQRDVERMAVVPQRRQSYQSSQDSYGYQQQTSQQAYQPQNGGGSGTLDQQASALRSNGTNPYASRPLNGSGTASIAPANNQFSEADEQREAERRLSEDPQPQPQQQQQQEQTADDQQPEQRQASLPPAAAAGGNSIRFLPIIGAPVEAVTPLSRQLGADARSLGLTIKSSADSSAAYILKGYLSAFEDGPQISVTYVWDVLDSNGNRVHRIQGSESAPLKRGDPWSAVPPSVMQKIATKTMSDFNSWHDSSGG